MNNELSCKFGSIRINISASNNPYNTTYEIWCPYSNEYCSQLLDTSSFWIEGVIATAIGFTGILMNIIFCYVLSRREMRNVFNFLLIALVFFDNIYLLCHSLEAFRLYFSMTSEIYILLIPKFFYPLRRISFCSSMFMIIAISMERYIAVSRPISLHLNIRNDRKQQIKRVLKYVLPVFISSVIVCLPSFFSTSTYYDDELKLLQLKIRDKFRQSPNYGVYYKGIIRLLIGAIIPFSTILCLNFKTYGIIRKRRKNQTSLNLSNGNEERINNEETESPFILRRHLAGTSVEKSSEENLSIIFLAIAIIFVVCHSPRAVIHLYDIIAAGKYLDCTNAGYSGSPVWYRFVYDIGHAFAAINSSVNSAVYCVFSSKYREQAKKSLRCFKFLRN